MKYASTRGGVTGWTFEEALFCPGYVADGGILMPEIIPRFSEQDLQAMSNLSYVDLVRRILPLFISEDEIPEADIQEIITKAVKKLGLEDVVHLAELKNGLNVLELFHGKTLTFKDIGTTFVGQFMDYFLEKKKKFVTLVVGTSGDTGSAAIQGVCDSKWIDIIVLLPHGGRCSQIQELQMTTVIKDNVHNFCVDGSSDDIDILIKKVVLDLPFVDQHNLGTMNSINWGRVMVQTVHYFYAYFSQAKSIGDVVEVIVPTGGLGNCTAGCFASKMGLPIRLVCAVNTNDIVHRSFSIGDYSVAAMKRTLSPAMDIQVAYNIERIMWLVSDGDCDLVSKVLVHFESNKYVTRIPPDLLSKIQKLIGSGVTDDETTMKTMVRCWQENDYLLCPHTAVAVAYYYRKSEREREEARCVCIATASPVKFPETVLKAGLTPHTTDEVSNLKNMPTKYTEMKLGEDWESMLRNRIISISKKNGSV